MPDKIVSYVLKTVGEYRTDLGSWMKSILATNDDEKADRFVMIESTHVVSKSELLSVNAPGYNPTFDFEEQILITYLLSTAGL